MTTDIFATVAALANHAEEALPGSLVIDGRDLTGVLLGDSGAGPHKCLFHYKTGAWLGAVRCGELKLMFDVHGKPGAMYNLTADVSESHALAPTSATYRTQAPVITAARAAQIASVEPVVDQVNLGWDAKYGLCGFPQSKTAFPDSPNCTSDPSLWFPFGSKPPTPAPPPPPSPVQPGAFQGCWWDKGFPAHGGEEPCDLPVVERGGCPRGGMPQQRDAPSHGIAKKMTLELCNVLCNGHGFFGVQNGGTGCFCGDAFGRYGRCGNCSMPCAGNASQTCGGPGANSVYAVTN